MKLKSIDEAKSYILKHTSHRPCIAVVCGSGLGSLCDSMSDSEQLNCQDIPHFPVSTVPGHAGKLAFGRLGGKVVVCLKGRVHAYEGHSMWNVTFYMRVLAAIGVKVAIVTNASGGLLDEINEGDVVVLKDHINLPGMVGHNPLIGLNDPRFGVRFQETTSAYDKPLQKLALNTAMEMDLDYVRSGVYMYLFGPTFECPMEVRFCRMAGADVVGMSTVPEVVVARHCGVRCLGLSLVTNKCVADHDNDNRPNHEEVLEMGSKRSAAMQNFVTQILYKIQNV